MAVISNITGASLMKMKPHHIGSGVSAADFEDDLAAKSDLLPEKFGVNTALATAPAHHCDCVLV